MKTPARSCLLGLLCALTLNANAGFSATVTEPSYLGNWLVLHRLSTPLISADDNTLYAAGLAWQSAAERDLQEQQRQQLIDTISKTPARANDARDGLLAFIKAHPATGRVIVQSADARWLQTNPSADPYLQTGDRILIPDRPTTVTVVREDGTLCVSHYQAGVLALQYVRACDAHAAPDIAWIVQPDGNVSEKRVADWNREAQDTPAPGSWIWAPDRNSGWTPDVSRAFAKFLATQGASGFADDGTPMTTTIDAPTMQAMRAAAFPITDDDWGEAGVLQTPTARMHEASDAAVSISHVAPYTRMNVMLQPLDWLAFGFRYTNISNRFYGAASFSGSQRYKDKSVDVRARLFQETAYTPDLAVGMRDIAGTGLFSGEYVVASKRTGAFDWSLGLGWGYLGERGDFNNPLALFGDKFNTRKIYDASTSEDVGTPHPSAWFRGRTALFGGVQYQTPWQPLILKLEYEGNDYLHEPFDTTLAHHTPFNFGAVVRVNNNIDLSLGYERGDEVMLGISLHGLLKNYSMVKLGTPPPPPPVVREAAWSADDVIKTPASATMMQTPASTPTPTENAGSNSSIGAKEMNWSDIVPVLQTQTRWRVHRVYQHEHELIVEFDDIDAFYIQDQLNRIAAELNLVAPADITRFRVVPRNYGVPITDYQIDRAQWVATHAQAPLPDAPSAIRIVSPLSPAQQNEPAFYEQQPKRLTTWFGPGYSQTVGGPNAFLLYELSAQAKAEFRFTPDLWLSGNLKLRLLDNYNNYTYDQFSGLPPVRTHLREYQTSSYLQMSSLQLTKFGRLSDDQFYSVYGGYLESMFAGVGGEWLYRMPDKPLAIGIDVNEVQQRGFHQNFGLRDYTAFTGHVTAYWKTGWHDVQINLSAGQYLAGDRGATLDISRTFRNGVVFGGFITRTNVPYSEFGEGSFDKGIYVKIPFDAMFTYATKGIADIIWDPLTRDGGAKLDRQYPLYDMTNFDDTRSLWYQPPEAGAKP